MLLRGVPLAGDGLERMDSGVTDSALFRGSLGRRVPKFVEGLARSVSSAPRLRDADCRKAAKREQLLLTAKSVLQAPESTAGRGHQQEEAVVVEQLVGAVGRLDVSDLSVVQSHWGYFPDRGGTLPKMYPRFAEAPSDGTRCIETRSGSKLETFQDALRLILAQPGSGKSGLGGRDWIRTSVAVKREIYSLVDLTTLPPFHGTASRTA